LELRHFVVFKQVTQWQAPCICLYESNNTHWLTADQQGDIEMKKLTKTTVITLALVTVFASAALATSADEYEFTALDKDVVIEYPAPVSHEECNEYAAQQNKIDVALDAFQYDLDISASECIHPDHASDMTSLELETTLNDLGFDG